MDIGISTLNDVPAAQAPFEMVERKGTGHPDTICDALAEAFSRALSRYYRDRFGAILHHNVDKALLVAGASRPAFGGGEVLEPMEIYLTGRAVTEYRGLRLPVEAIAIESSRAWLREHLHALDAERHVRLHVQVRPTSPELQEIFSGSAAALANDSSLGAGYAPLDALERVVLAAERRLNDSASRAAHPELGEDVKVIGVRRGEAIRLTVACALIGRHLSGVHEYFAAKSRAAALARAAAREITSQPVDVVVNAADGTREGTLYVTVTGTSAEAGDDGQVGRGNRVNGLITPYRPMTLEAAAGKNPATHVGKLYNVAAHRIASSCVTALHGVEEAYCYLVSEIGRPVAEPAVVDIRLRLARELRSLPPRTSVESLLREELARMQAYWRESCAGEPSLW